ncbi:type II toxin-antitoxin system RelE/ParE family toxin [Enterovirga sp. DB1703]|uniref:Type II toxin-antitoxin system RelE/ParE family toxin n=1 Tax=Enterovirga aerilata TaxID=2730920 RepID=A0A849I5H6_9HYPH|nr:type II toxin-antitoxin system RelE/ParE family toxin [Enterovirga sp. DB1703]
MRSTFDLFGPRQVATYTELIEAAICDLAVDPERIGSRPRPELGRAMRSLHLSHVAGRQRGARHEIYYRVQAAKGGQPELVIMRILHDAMDPAGRVKAALRGDLRRS